MPRTGAATPNTNKTHEPTTVSRMATSYQLSFEQPIHEIEAQIRDLESVAADSSDVRDQIGQLRRQLNETIRSIYKNLDPWETVRVARHPERPMFTDYVENVFDEFVELHGDKFFGDDRALRTGFAKLDEFKVMLVGHHKGKTTKERTDCFFGCAHPEGYRKAISKMRLAAKYGLPIITLIDTAGAYPGIGAEERGQAQAIAENMLAMSLLPTP
ncbi:MAG TPA: carboxyl transferase domain-containing protein, partial [Lacipirellulaceae bacterium]|nr:carboxyl transferase domain-containing protein [Lacipirellulaceae bacterium]